MATNFEFYKDEILKVSRDNMIIALTKNGEIQGCNQTDCCNCAFGEWDCRLRRFEWLYEEHIEAPKLTKRERAFCEAVQKGWIARDECGDIFWCKGEPKKRNGIWSNGDDVCIDFTDLHLFLFIKWEDKKPWAVEDLLKLEVIEEVQ